MEHIPWLPGKEKRSIKIHSHLQLMRSIHTYPQSTQKPFIVLGDGCLNQIFWKFFFKFLALKYILNECYAVGM